MSMAEDMVQRRIGDVWFRVCRQLNRTLDSSRRVLSNFGDFLHLEGPVFNHERLIKLLVIIVIVPTRL